MRRSVNYDRLNNACADHWSDYDRLNVLRAGQNITRIRAVKKTLKILNKIWWN